MEQKEWFEEWFDSEYYHILYQHRDDQDAQMLINNLYSYLKLKEGDFVADIACGKGRHANLLNQKKLRVLGTDLSENSIQFARQFANETLTFEVNDMREVMPYQFDVIFNLFTSFGYFSCQDENLKVVKAFKKMLAADGFIVIDFFNAQKVANTLIKNEDIQLSGIDFKITRKIQHDHIIKEINFEINQKNHHFEEQVQMLTLDDFKLLFEKAELEIVSIFGNYHLESFDVTNSDRLLIIAKHLHSH